VASLQAGGAEKVLAALVNHWASRGHHVTLLTFGDGTLPNHYSLRPEINHLPLDLLGKSQNPVQALANNFRRIWRLKHSIFISSPDIVVSFGDHVNILTLLATMMLPAPVVISERNDPAHRPIGWIWNLLRRYAYPLAAFLVVQTEGAAGYFPKAMKEKIRVIPNPVSLPLNPEGPAESTKRKSEHTVLAMGSLTKQKGFDILIEVFAKISSKYDDWSLVIRGDGVERENLELLRNRLGLERRVSLPGVTQTPIRDMQDADLFVLSSRYEGFPNVLLEAMASGLPVLSADCPSGPRDIVEDGVNGVLVSPNDVDALAAALDDLMADEEKRRRLGAAATGVLERFSLSRITDIWDSLLAEVVST
jgi:GalNAc-alpha-(1->4)-GalNAc-alpha-(1->3)-diNAcBac-PP-undecaprenol alpha-1,4-N-acetyl-D-galactosaminyltransferase